MTRRIVLDVAGLCIAARNEPYVQAVIARVGTGRRHGDRPRARLRSVQRRARQRHRRAWRGFRRHVRGRPGACRRGVVPAVLAICERGEARPATTLLRGIADGRELMCRAQPRGAEGDPQGGLPSDRGVRRAWPPRPRVGRGAAARQEADSSMRWASPAAWPRASSNISPRAPGPSACMPGWAAQSGIRAALMARARLPRAAHRVRRRRTASSTPSRRRASRRLRRCCSTASARAG